MPGPQESLVTAALEEIEQGAPIQPTAAKYGVARSTLQGRLHGRMPRSEARQRDQRLSPEQETFLAQWCLHEEASGRAPRRKKVRAMGQAILDEGGSCAQLGVRWIDRFLKRNPQINMKNSDLLERARARGSTRHAYEAFFDLLERQIKEKKILPRNIANMDEHGLQEGESATGRVIGSSLTKRTYVTGSDATNWVSIIECGTAQGHRLKPCIIFTGESLQGQWYSKYFEKEEQIPDWKYDYSPTGWSNNRIALKWLKEIYLPGTKPENPAEWRLLVLDEHATHTQEEFMRIAFQSKVQLLFLPPHTSHKTQPLDRSVFAAVKAYFREGAADLADHITSAPVNKQRFLLLYRDASERGVRSANLRSGFRQTGIWPLDRNQILQDAEAVIEPEAAPTTPPRQEEPPELAVWVTPRGREDLTRYEDALQGRVSAAQRDVRVLFRKIGRAFDGMAAEIAQLRAQNKRQAIDLEALQPRTRKKVKLGANDRFATLPEIVKAKNASLEVQERPEPMEPTLQPEAIAQAQGLLNSALECIHVHLED
jgi:hypothetical protein